MAELPAIVEDVGWMALLLLIGQLLRAKVRVVQALYLPVSIVAGILGLVLGPQVLGWIPFSELLPKYAWVLVTVLFATFPFSTPAVGSAREVMRRAGTTFCFNFGGEVAVFAVALAVGLWVLPLFGDLSESFAILMPAGFVGGHAYATAIGGALERQGVLPGAIALGYTFATVGLLSAILVGVPLIRWGIRRGWASQVADLDQLPASYRTGLLGEDERTPFGRESVSSASLDPLAFHVVWVAIAAAGGFLLTELIAKGSAEAWGTELYLPEIATAMICGLVGKMVFAKLGLTAKLIDQRVMTRIGGTATDWLVGFGIASIRIDLVGEHWVAIAALSLFGIALAVTYVFTISRRVHKAHWFERAIFVFGWLTGVVAMGVTLLRIVDPDFRTQTLETYGMAYVLIAPLEILLVTLVPIAIGYGASIWLAAGLFAAFGALMTGAWMLRSVTV